MTARGKNSSTAENEALELLSNRDYDAALDVLMGEYGDAVYRFCRQMTGQPELAEEAHQLTFIQAYESIGTFSRRSSLKTWLFGIARHRCLDALRKLRRQQNRFEENDILDRQPDSTPDLDQSLETHELTRALQYCLKTLAPRIRAAVLLRFQEEMTYPQMARVCRERTATLQARVTRALPALRICLEKRGITL